MTARKYPCPGCGSFKGTARETWNHILKAHRMRLIEGLGLIEAFGTRKEAIAP